MANTKQVTTLATFASGIDNIKMGGDSLVLGLRIVAQHITKATSYVTQQDLLTQASKAYQQFKKVEATALGNKDYSLSDDSARKAIIRAVKKVSPKYVAIVSDNKQAKSNRKARKARAGGKALKAGTKPTEKKASKATVITNVNWQKDIIENIKSLERASEGFIPSGKIEAYRNAYAAFVVTLETILK